MRAAAQVQGKTHAMVRTTKDTASFQKSSHFTMTTQTKSTIVGAAQEQASSAGKHEDTRGVVPKAKYYRIQMHLGKDLFEGFFNRNG